MLLIYCCLKPRDSIMVSSYACLHVVVVLLLSMMFVCCRLGRIRWSGVLLMADFCFICSLRPLFSYALCCVVCCKRMRSQLVLQTQNLTDTRAFLQLLFSDITNKDMDATWNMQKDCSINYTTLKRQVCLFSVDCFRCSFCTCIGHEHLVRIASRMLGGENVDVARLAYVFYSIMAV